MDADRPPFDGYALDEPGGPVVLSVPHAGRDYPLPLRAALRVPLEALRPLEDRHVDTLALAARRDETMLVQRRARAWIDLNRAEHERDPAIDAGADRQSTPHASAKLRGGLGLIPRRVPIAGEIWQRRFEGEEIAGRILDDYRPYHAALSAALRRAHARHGVAILLDLHSMPPLGRGLPRIVLGDRFGRSAAARFVNRLESVAAQAGIATALNSPYAGGHILDRHGHVAGGFHAIQIEFDRSLYLDAALDQPGAGLAPMATLVRGMIDSLIDEALTPRDDRLVPLAAE
ncbi:N-formylglutamate amidohydrolase [Sphingomonas sp. AR_OL41]|uniref:N-formylglutamate amidohydrolase n=1 Tax=Sphingomonas sp. AR_OL41 TaxID=3042729 RepID=UPI002480182A|nr:N-formylglutamate amidohydrolase [Sphingomonas sp. AR_OL41]MDH7974732.1 N-formylglutamate amidohydrolase [Sphingomonas sp. AR_OL41]